MHRAVVHRQALEATSSQLSARRVQQTMPCRRRPFAGGRHALHDRHAVGAAIAGMADEARSTADEPRSPLSPGGHEAVDHPLPRPASTY